MTVLLLLAAQATYSTQSVGCAAINHKPAADVEYMQGQDANGYAVAPADVSPPSLNKEDFRRVAIPFELPMENYPARKPDFAKSDKEWQKQQNELKEKQGKKPDTPIYSIDTSHTGIQPGLATVDTQSGKVEFEGKELTPPEPAELNPDCWQK